MGSEYIALTLTRTDYIAQTHLLAKVNEGCSQTLRRNKKIVWVGEAMKHVGELLVTCLIVLVITLSPGCGVISSSEEKVLDKLDIDLESIQTGQKSKEDIHKILGEPIVKSDYWNLEVYRDSATQSMVLFVFIYPAGYFWDTIDRYTFVIYDENEILSEISTCLYNKNATGDLPKDNICALGAEKYQFHISAEKDSDGVILYLPEDLEDFSNTLKERDRCSVFIASTNTYLSTVTLDKTDPIALWPASILYYSVGQGEHTLKFAGSRFRGSDTINLRCSNNENIYLEVTLTEIETKVVDSFIMGLTLRGYEYIGSANYIINSLEKWPDHFWELPIMLWSDKTWIINRD